MSSAENHSMIALSPKPSYLKTSSLCTRVHFSSKITFVFENLSLFALWRSRPEYPPYWAEYPVGPDIPGSLWPEYPAGSGWVFKGRGWGAVLFPHP
jgi:hypothetical protein